MGKLMAEPTSSCGRPFYFEEHSEGKKTREYTELQRKREVREKVPRKSSSAGGPSKAEAIAVRRAISEQKQEH